MEPSKKVKSSLKKSKTLKLEVYENFRGDYCIYAIKGKKKAWIFNFDECGLSVDVGANKKLKERMGFICSDDGYLEVSGAGYTDKDVTDKLNYIIERIDSL